VTLDADAQTAALAFPQPIAPGRYRLAIDFTARINTFRNDCGTPIYACAVDNPQSYSLGVGTITLG
jgi:hypothetical protein